MAKTKFFRVATSGATTDGRVIDEQTLRDMAETYDPKTYQARGNLEHYRWSGAFADVLALKTEPVKLMVGGREETRLGLYAQVDALDPLTELHDKKQKIFSSIEVTPNFAKSGKAYLTGMAFTDNPASLGTEMMKFCADLTAKGAGEGSPLHFRKSQPDAFFTAAEEIAFEYETTPIGAPGANPSPETNAIMDALRRVFGNFSSTAPAAPIAPPAPAVTPAATDPAVLTAFAGLNDVMQQFATSNAAQAQRLDQLATDFAAFRADAATLRTDLAAAQTEQATLRATLEKTPAALFTTRPPATGGGGNTSLKTDC